MSALVEIRDPMDGNAAASTRATMATKVQKKRTMALVVNIEGKMRRG